MRCQCRHTYSYMYMLLVLWAGLLTCNSSGTPFRNGRVVGSVASLSESASVVSGFSRVEQYGKVADLFAEVGRHLMSRVNIDSIGRSFSSALISKGELEGNVEGDGIDDTLAFLSVSVRRSLAAGDFEELNDLLKGTTIYLPDTSIEQKILFQKLFLDLKNIRCSEISIQDIVLSLQSVSDQKVEMPVEILGLDMRCDVDWRYKWGIFHDGGSAQMFTDNNSAKTVIAFTSQDFNTHAPNGNSVVSCEPNINIVDINIQGDLIAQVINAVEKTIRGTISNEIESVMCEELGSLGSSAVSDLIGLASDYIDGYTGRLPDEVADPLSAEKKMTVPSDLNLLDLSDTDNTMGGWFSTAIDKVKEMLGSFDNGDLGINKMLREKILDENKAFVVPISSLPSSVANDGVIFQGQDILTETTIAMTEVRLLGLDSFVVFDPLNNLGRFSLTNSFKLRELQFEADLTITMKPSSHSSAVLVNEEGRTQVEQITLQIGVEDLEVDLSFLLALDLNELGNIQLGSILQTSQILPCLVSVIHQATLTGLSVSVEKISVPTLSGFVSEGVDTVLTTAAEAAFNMYRAPIKDATPNFFQTTVRDILNDLLQKVISGGNAEGECPLFSGTLRDDQGVIDFRDFFLSPTAAAAAGGAGLAPYGDVGSMLIDIVNKQILAPDHAGSPKVNSMIIRPMTKAQSGREGILHFASELFQIKEDKITDLFWSAFAQSFDLNFSDLTLENIDTLHHPITLLSPSTSNPIELKNSVNFGYEGSSAGDSVANVPTPVKASIRAFVEIGGNTPLAMRNLVDIGVEMPTVGVIADVLASVQEKALMEFPIKDLMNVNCWLATILAPDFERLRNSSIQNYGLSFSRLFVSFPTFRLSASCVSCSTAAFGALPDVINTLDQAGTLDVVKQRSIASIEEIWEENWIQSNIERVYADAPQKCPHHSAYFAGHTDSVLANFSLPGLTKDNLDLIFLTGALIMHSGVIVVAEAHLPPLSASIPDPLSAQKSLNVPLSAKLLDFSHLGASLGAFGGLADSAMSQVRSKLRKLVDDPIGPNASTTGRDLYLNVLLRDAVLDKDRALPISLNDFRLDSSGLSVLLRSIRILGLDTFANLDLLDTIGPQTLLNKFVLEELEVEINLSIVDFESEDRGLRSAEDEVKITFGLKDISAEFALLFALDLNFLGDLELGSILRVKQMLPCILSASREVELTQLSLSISDFVAPTITGFVSDETERIIRDSTQVLMEKYKADIIRSVPAIFDQSIHPLVNNIISSFVNAESDQSCPSLYSPELSGFVNFHDLLETPRTASVTGGLGKSQYGDIFRYLAEVIDDQVLGIDSNGLSRMNEIVFGPITRAQSGVTGSLLFPGDIFGGASKIHVGGLKAVVELRAFDAAIQNIDSVGEPLNLLNPIDNMENVLDNTASFGVGSKPVRGSVGLLVGIDDDDGLSMRNEILLSADLNAATLLVEALVQMREESFLTFPLRDVTNVNCWLATMPAAELNEFGVRGAGTKTSLTLQHLAVSLSNLNLGVECISCTSPGFEELTDMLSSPKGIEDATAAANQVANYITSLLGGEFLNAQVDRLLFNAAKKCPHHEEYDPDFVIPKYKIFDAPDTKEASLKFLLALLVIGSVLSTFVIIATIIIKRSLESRHEKWILSLSAGEFAAVHARQIQDEEEEEELSHQTSALATSKSVPIYVRIIMPLVVIGNIVLFLSGHLSLGATVNVEATVAGEKLVIGDFFMFSMANSVGDMWNAGAKSLAIFILTFSGVWPYTKQFITLVLWFTPPNRVSTSRRGSIFIWLDVLGKWSMVDIFVLLCTLAAFHIQINSPDVAFLPDGFYSVNLMVIPMWGLYANMIAQLISQVSSHFVIYFHRKVVNDAREQSGLHEYSDGSMSRTPTPPQALCNHCFQTGFDSKSATATVHPRTNKLVVLGAVLVTISIILGCSFNSFSLEVMGIMGIAVESGQDFARAKRYYNLFTLVGSIMEEARFLDTGRYYVGLGTLSALLLVSTLLVPIIQAWVLVRQWISPLSDTRRRRCQVMVEILLAWQYAEVYILSIIITAWQIAGVSSFMVNDYCGSLDDTFAQMAYYEIIDPADAQCFLVEAQLEFGVYVLLLGTILLSILTKFVTRAARQRDSDIDQYRKESTPRFSTFRGEHDEDLDNGKVGEPPARLNPAAVRYTDIYRPLLLLNESTSSERPGIFNELVSEEKPQLSVEGEFLNRKDRRGGEVV